MRRPRETIEKLPGGFLIDIEGNRSIETSDTVAHIILRIWPDVALRIAAAWRLAEIERTEEINEFVGAGIGQPGVSPTRLRSSGPPSKGDE